ncbi:STN domain-containing protein [Dyella silvatica]|uniref:STN domain-containing protein n=1 Tax=Dyella silvatica TaxID=2992128 RepID=UPI002253E374|nr:STN domain-containing protein [Dyella silvatica]
MQQQDSPVVTQSDHTDLARFDIEPQALMTALRTYSEVTGLAVLVDDRLASGRQSPGVIGEFTVDEALQRLLDGTGLTVRYASDHAFTLVPADSLDAKLPKANQPETGRLNDAAEHSYLGLLQRAIERALCRSEPARQGDYRLAMQLWIADTGEVERTHLLDSTGSTARDAEILKVMDHLLIGSPPSSMPQPLTLLLLPGRTLSCHASAAMGS